MMCCSLAPYIFKGKIVTRARTSIVEILEILETQPNNSNEDLTKRLKFKKIFSNVCSCKKIYKQKILIRLRNNLE